MARGAPEVGRPPPRDPATPHTQGKSKELTGKMTDLSQLRSEIDRIDTQLFELFSQRVDVARRIGDYKRERGLAVFDPTR